MLYNLLIADDNIVDRDVVELILKQLPETGSITTCEDAFQIQTALENNEIDVVFSDIEMPGLNGLNMLKKLSNPPPFVFITSFADYASETFDVDAIDFVLKPVTAQRVTKAAKKAFDYIALKEAATNYSAGLTMPAVSHSDSHFYIRETKGITRLKYDDVKYIESMKDFSRIFKADGQSHVILSGLKSLEEQLPDHIFKRVHRQYIVNMDYVETVSRYEVFLVNDITIQLTAAFRQGTIDAFVKKKPIRR